jgi:hypothetical protein
VCPRLRWQGEGRRGAHAGQLLAPAPGGGPWNASGGAEGREGPAGCRLLHNLNPTPRCWRLRFCAHLAKLAGANVGGHGQPGWPGGALKDGWRGSDPKAGSSVVRPLLPSAPQLLDKPPANPCGDSPNLTFTHTMPAPASANHVSDREVQSAGLATARGQPGSWLCRDCEGKGY